MPKKPHYTKVLRDEIDDCKNESRVVRLYEDQIDARVKSLIGKVVERYLVSYGFDHVSVLFGILICFSILLG